MGRAFPAEDFDLFAEFIYNLSTARSSEPIPARGMYV
jgi:hypothetical protein